MFGRKGSQDRKQSAVARVAAPRGAMIEALEGRTLLSASAVHHAAHHAVHHATAKHAALHASVKKSSSTKSTSSSGSTTSESTSDTYRTLLDTIQFSQAPNAVQSGLKSLASSDSLTVPTSTQTVYLGNADGIETYTLIYTSSGTTTRITVDPNGKAVTAPTETTITWGTLDGTGTGSNAKAAAEISAIAAALGLSAPASSTTVYVKTASDGTVTYSVRLADSSSTSAYDDDQTTVSVDANGNPVGNQYIPFSTLPAAIQDGINANLPSGATALSASSTQRVHVLTANGVTSYSTTFTVSGTTTTVTVNSSGVLASLPSTTTVDFSTLPKAAQTALQTLATANGVSGTISSTQSVIAYNEGNGTTIYTVSLSTTDSSSRTFTLTISVDENGNPTVPPGRGGEGCGDGDGGVNEGDLAGSDGVEFGQYGYAWIGSRS